MIDPDVAIRLRDAGLTWTPADGDLFVIDTEELRREVFMLSPMVVEHAMGRHGRMVFRFNGTTEWALDSVEQDEAIWIPRTDQLVGALGDRLQSMERTVSGWIVHAAAEDGMSDVGPPPVTAPHLEDALAGLLLILLRRDAENGAPSADAIG